MYTVGRLAKKYGLSRSTLLYYDSIGLLSPAQHEKGAYRQYSERDAARLEKICLYRKAGISLDEIKRLLDSEASSEAASILRERLGGIGREMEALQNQQRIVTELLDKGTFPAAGAMDTRKWKDVFQQAGLTEEDMRRWHADFERLNPDDHSRFLRYLHFPDEEIELIRAWASAPHKILQLQKASGNFMQTFFRIYEGVERKGPGVLRV